MDCETCGGTNFYKESGFFFCNECQTQSQETREHVFEEATNINRRNTIKIKQPEQDKPEDKVTSWECYNFILFSLTQKLIDLGADKKLKPIVKYLWMRYLEKLEIINLKFNVLPKLPLVNIKRNVKILYNMPTKKRKKRKRGMSSSDGASSSSMDLSSLKRERSKKKRELVQAQYEEFSQSSKKGSSLYGETLSSLKSSSKQPTRVEPRRFNKYSMKELRTKMGHSHRAQHKLDIENKLNCHKFTHWSFSALYEKSMSYMSPIKLYSLLYLGLLINNDEMQLGDLFRFMREGHLPLTNCAQLLPEGYLDKFLGLTNDCNVLKMFSHKEFRDYTARLAKFLNVVRFIGVIDITRLCQRFCKEMNLPGDVFLAAQNIISKTIPGPTFTKKDSHIPNYEGRAMSIIIFVLKLLYGLDGITEFEFSKYAQAVNKLDVQEEQMFDIVKWMEYVGYRSHIIEQHHFPTYHLKNPNSMNSELFVQYAQSMCVTNNSCVKLTNLMKSYKGVLENIIKLSNKPSSITFPASLTPFLEYSKILFFHIKYGSKYILQRNFEDHSLDFLLRPNKYLQLVGANVTKKHGGANDNWIIEEDISYNSKMFGKRGLIPVEVIQNGNEENLNNNELYRKSDQPNKKLDSQYVQENYEKYRKHIFLNNERHIERVSKRVKLKHKPDEVRQLRCYNNHFNPYERYWINMCSRFVKLDANTSKEYFNKQPNSFKLILEECSRTIQQSTKELLYEFTYSEIFLVYEALYRDTHQSKIKRPVSKKLLCERLQKSLLFAKKHW